MDVTRKVFARRDRFFTEADEHLMRYVASEAPKIEGAGAGNCAVDRAAPPVAATPASRLRRSRKIRQWADRTA